LVHSRGDDDDLWTSVRVRELMGEAEVDGRDDVGDDSFLRRRAGEITSECVTVQPKLANGSRE
jgi:hypothetical protein